MAASQPAPRPRRPPRARHLRRVRLDLPDGASTTLYVAEHSLDRVDIKVVRLARPRSLEAWCAERGVPEAIVGGFYVRPDGLPLGELRTRGIARRHVPFAAPWGAARGCVHVHQGTVRLLPRCEIEPAPAGDLLQAGPLLVRDGAVVYGDGDDAEGFSAGAHQFDSDITAERHPRAALAVAEGRAVAVVCDGRAGGEAGLTLGELAVALRDLGATAALNLDGGGSTSLVCAGRLRNRPREQHGIVIPGGRPVSTAIVFTGR